MAASVRRDLFLQIGGSADGLLSAAKIGKSAMLTLGASVDDVVGAIEKQFADMANGPIEASARTISQSYDRTFKAIAANARQVMAAPTPAAATQILNITGAEQAARAAESTAAGLKALADGAVIAARAEGEAGDAAKLLAASFTAQYGEAQRAAGALGRHVATLHAVADASGIAHHAEDELAVSHNRMGNSGMIAEHVVRSFSDSIAAGQSPVRALMLEMGRITEAMTLFGQQSGTSEGKLAKFIGFMGGPRGLAISVGAAVLTPLIGRLFETDESAQKAAQALKEFEQHELRLPEIIDKTTGRLREQTDAMRELAKTAREVIPGQIVDAEKDAKMARNDAFIAAKTKVASSGRSRSNANDADLNRAIYESGGSAKGLNDRIQAMLPHRSDLQELARTVADAYAKERLAIDKTAELRGQQAAFGLVAKGGTVLTPEVAKRQAEDAAATTPAEKAQITKRTLEERIEAIGRKPVSDSQQAEMRKAEQDLAAATRALRDVKAGDDDQSGRKVTLAQAEEIVHGIGGRITSAERSTSTQQSLWDKYQAYKAGIGPWAALAAKPGTSEHERGQALDIAKGGGMSLAKIVEAFRAEGVHLTERLDEGDHFHVAWGAKGSRGASPETLEHRQQAADDKTARDREAFGALRTRAEEEALRLQREQITGYAEGATLDRQTVDLERDRLNAAAMLGYTTRRWSKAEADGLTDLNDRNALLKKDVIDRTELSQQLADIFANETQTRGDRDALLQIDLEMADTRKDRLAAEKQLLADAQAERSQKLYATAIDPKTSPEEAARASRELGTMPARDAAEQRQLGARYQSPLDGFRDDLKKNVGGMGDALQGVAVNGLKGLEDGLTGILAGTKTVAQGFRDMAMSVIADLEKIAIEKVLLSFLGLSSGGKVPGYAGGGLPGYAGGGDPSVENGIIRGAGTGTSDSILAMVGRRPIRIANGEGIVNARGVQKHWPLIDAINHDRLPAFASGGRIDPADIYMRPLPAAASLTRAQTVQVLHVVTDKSALFDTHVVQLTAPLAQSAMLGGAAQARQDAADDAYGRIPT